MNFFKSVNHLKLKRHRFLQALPILALLCAIVVVGRAFVVMHEKMKLPALVVLRASDEKKCEEKCRPRGSETLPKGIVSSTSDFEFRPMWGSPSKKKLGMSLLAMAVGKKQKKNVDKIVRKFLNNNFTVVLFHYDGNVADWGDLKWSAHALHIAAGKQTKWWFAKRFLHPDIVAEYSYIFLWDEDLGVEHFNVQSYLSVIKNEGLEISQPAISLRKSKEFRYRITVRQNGMLVHRRYHGSTSKVKCDENSTEPPCTGFVEMMAPVFSRAAWRCTWYMIQNDLVHAWGLDHLFGYCAQGDRTQNIGIVDSDFIYHYGFNTLGGAATKMAPASRGKPNNKDEMRNKQYKDMYEFINRWKEAVEDDECWTDPLHQPKTGPGKVDGKYK